MRLVFVTQKVDVDDPILGATVAKLEALAARCEHVHVLALVVGKHDLPSNVSFATFGAPTRPQRLVRYLRALASALRRRPDVLLAHMAPVYLVLAAPLAKPFRVRLLLWYTHGRRSKMLRVATALCDRALTVDERSFPLVSPKVVPIGHGIDVSVFRPEARRRAGGPLKLLALGRMSRAKDLPTILRGFGLALEQGLDATLELRGPVATADEQRHRLELEELAAAEPLRGRVRIASPVSYGLIPALVKEFDALVNATHADDSRGGVDKAVLEAAASGLPVIACNAALDSLLQGLPLELHFRTGDPEELAQRLLALAASPEEARSAAARELRRRVEERHSTKTWADGVVRAVGNVRTRT
jgi:glycosyltransferase involved in cell wall biosynthesis